MNTARPGRLTKRQKKAAYRNYALERYDRNWKPPANFKPYKQVSAVGGTRVLLVTTEHFCAGAEWNKIYGVWSCIKAAQPLSWMKGMSVDEAKLALLRMGAKFYWTDATSISSLVTANITALINHAEEV